MLDDSKAARNAGFTFEMTDDGRIQISKGFSPLAFWSYDGHYRLTYWGKENQPHPAENKDKAVEMTAKVIADFR